MTEEKEYVRECPICGKQMSIAHEDGEKAREMLEYHLSNHVRVHSTPKLMFYAVTEKIKEILRL